ncbi:hypothetical protein AgCh_032064 [Apium graveolens]
MRRLDRRFWSRTAPVSSILVEILASSEKRRRRRCSSFSGDDVDDWRRRKEGEGVCVAVHQKRGRNKLESHDLVVFLSRRIFAGKRRRRRILGCWGVFFATQVRPGLQPVLARQSKLGTEGGELNQMLMMQQQMQQQQQQFQQQMLQQAAHPGHQVPPAAPTVTFKQFKSEEQKTDFASYFLKREANYWWESKKALEEEGVVTWDRFTDLFLEKYFPRFMKNQMEIKFLELKQDNLSVADYETKFTELARFVPEQVDTDEKRAKRFQQGLKPWIRSRVAVFELTTYTAVVQKAVIIEGESEAAQKEKGPGNSQNRFNKRPGFQARGKANFRRPEQNNQRMGNRLPALTQQRLIRPSIPDCRTCGKKHTGICNKPNVTCFKCKQRGHYSGECLMGRTEVTCF